MDLDVKTPEAPMSSNENKANDANSNIEINTAAESQESTPAAEVKIESPTEEPAAPEQATVEGAASPPEAEVAKPTATEPTPTVDATLPVSPNNVINTKVDGTDTAKQVAEQTDAERNTTRETMLANGASVDPSKPPIDGIKGQPMAEDLASANEQPPPVQTTNNPALATNSIQTPSVATETQPNAQAQPAKKKPWYKFW